jgi:hypothetical protein
MQQFNAISRTVAGARQSPENRLEMGTWRTRAVAAAATQQECWHGTSIRTPDEPAHSQAACRAVMPSSGKA